MTAFRRMGDFVPVAYDLCVCGHDGIDHQDDEDGFGPCNAYSKPDEVFISGVPCGCDQFEDADVDSDFVPGLDDQDEEAGP